MRKRNNGQKYLFNDKFLESTKIDQSLCVFVRSTSVLVSPDVIVRLEEGTSLISDNIELDLVKGAAENALSSLNLDIIVNTVSIIARIVPTPRFKRFVEGENLQSSIEVIFLENLFLKIDINEDSHFP